MNILGVDYGTKRIGLAWCDSALGVVLPYGILANVKEVANLIQKEQIKKVVIGLPRGLDGEENENTNIVREFARELQSESNALIEFVDERFSSAQADRLAGEATRDEKAAMVILQAYLEKSK